MVPKPPAYHTQVSLRTWDAGVSPPLVAVEFVSENNARKDYEIAPDKYAASGTYELWVFDPELLGPRLRVDHAAGEKAYGRKRGRSETEHQRGPGGTHRASMQATGPRRKYA